MNLVTGTSDNSVDVPIAQGGTGIITAMVGLFLLVNGLWLGCSQIISTSWPTTQATTIEIVPARQRSHGSAPLRVTYSYSVDGKQFANKHPANQSLVGRLVGYTGPTEFRSVHAAKAEADRLAALGPVIHYNPADPAESVVWTGLHSSAIAQVTGGLGILLGGIALLLGAIPFFEPPPRLDSALLLSAFSFAILGGVVFVGLDFGGWVLPNWLILSWIAFSALMITIVVIRRRPVA